MAYEFKKLSDVNAIEAVSANTNVLVEENGEIVKVAANNFASNSNSNSNNSNAFNGIFEWDGQIDGQSVYGEVYCSIDGETKRYYKVSDEVFPEEALYKGISITSTTTGHENSISTSTLSSEDIRTYYGEHGESFFCIKGHYFAAISEDFINQDLQFGDFTLNFPEKGLYLYQEEIIDGEAYFATYISKIAFLSLIKPIDDLAIPTTVPVIRSAYPGQVIVVKNNDYSNDMPTEWEAINLSWENLSNKPFGEEINSVILAEENTEISNYVEGNNTYSTSLSIEDEDAYSNIKLDTEIYAELNDNSIQTYIKELTFDHPYTGISQTYWYIGNPGYFAGSNYNDESEGSFAIAFFDSEMQIFIPESIDTAYVKVSAFTSSIKTIPEKFIPSTVPSIQSAAVGQTIAVKAVDENGRPTEWEVVDIITEARVNELIAAAIATIPNAEEASF